LAEEGRTNERRKKRRMRRIKESEDVNQLIRMRERGLKVFFGVFSQDTILGRLLVDLA